MDVKDFDYWYDTQVWNIYQQLPDPRLSSLEKIVFPINFSELPCAILQINEKCTKVQPHTIEFRKIILDGKIQWEHINRFT